MKTVTVRDFTRHLPKITDDAAADGAPVLVTKGKSALRLGVWFTFESAVRRGYVCRHGEEPAKCPVCGTPAQQWAGRPGGHMWTTERAAANPDLFWEDLVLHWARLCPRYRVDLICGEPLAEAALDRLLDAGKLVVVRAGFAPSGDLIKTAELALRDGDHPLAPRGDGEAEPDPPTLARALGADRQGIEDAKGRAPEDPA